MDDVLSIPGVMKDLLMRQVNVRYCSLHFKVLLAFRFDLRRKLCKSWTRYFFCSYRQIHVVYILKIILNEIVLSPGCKIYIYITFAPILLKLRHLAYRFYYRFTSLFLLNAGLILRHSRQNSMLNCYELNLKTLTGFISLSLLVEFEIALTVVLRFTCLNFFIIS